MPDSGPREILITPRLFGALTASESTLGILSKMEREKEIEAMPEDKRKDSMLRLFKIILQFQEMLNSRLC